MLSSTTKLILMVVGFLATIQLATQTPIDDAMVRSLVAVAQLKQQSQIALESQMHFDNASAESNNNNNIGNNIFESSDAAVSDVDLNFRVDKISAQDIMNQVPLAERGQFVLYHLAKALYKAISSESVEAEIRLPRDADILNDTQLKFEQIPTYSGFSNDLLEWSKTILGRNNFGMQLFLVQKRACPPWGCFDPNDVGQMCCPF